MHLRMNKGDDITSMSLTELRSDFLSYAARHQIRKVPNSRTALDEQIKKARQLVIAERRQHGRRDGNTEASLDDIMRAPGIRRE